MAFKFKMVNNNRKNPCYQVPVVFHNLRGYDGHHLMQAIGKYKKRRISCIANNSERYITFSLSGLRFIDSFQFMGTSLEKLVDNLSKEEFMFLKKFVDGEERQNLLLRKGIYPYDYVDGPAKLQETKLPTQDQFYSKLNDEGISDDDYNHAKNVWHGFQCQTMGDYHDVYLKSDVCCLRMCSKAFERWP